MAGPAAMGFAAALVCLAAAGCAPSAASSGTDAGILEELNRLRADPPAYAKRLNDWRRYFRGKGLGLPGQVRLRTAEGVGALDEAVAVLRRTSPRPPLSASRGLTHAARDHVRDIGPKGLISHDGSDGSRPADRDRRYVRSVGAVGECISFGPREAENVVGQLVIDDGVHPRAHRQILLDPRFGAAGIACGPHARYGWMCVIDLAGRAAER